MQVGETNKNGNTLILGGWKANLLRTKTGRFIVGIQILETEEEAMRAYNFQNKTLLDLDYISKRFQPWYEKAHGVNKEYKVPSRSNPDRYHRVRIDPLGNFSCDCLGFTYRNECWHIDAVKELSSKEYPNDR